MYKTYGRMNHEGREEKHMEMGMLLSSTGGAGDLTATTGAAVSLVTSVLGLFEVYPLNIILTFTLCGYAFKFFGRGRKAAAGTN